MNAITLDRLIGEPDAVRLHGLVLKIDVEGFEKEVLEGAARLIALAAWWRALLEFSPSCLRAAGKDVTETWRFFRRYRGVVVGGGALPERPPLRDVELLIGQGEPADSGTRA